MLLKIKPGNRTNWISFAIAHHLNGSHDLAVQMLDTFENNIMGVRAWQLHLKKLSNLRHALADHRITIMSSVKCIRWRDCGSLLCCTCLWLNSARLRQHSSAQMAEILTC